MEINEIIMLLINYYCVFEVEAKGGFAAKVILIILFTMLG
jgi:hypothetical protein